MDVTLYRFCPLCKNVLKKEKNKVSCPKCGFTGYNNQSACASSLPVKNGNVLLCTRKFEPYRGEYDLIGGFLEPLEHPKDGAVRETKEETGLDVEIKKELGIYPDIYGEKGHYTISLNYVVKIVGGEIIPQDDVASLKWVPIKNIPELKLNGFKNTRDTLIDLHKLYSINPREFDE